MDTRSIFDLKGIGLGQDAVGGVVGIAKKICVHCADGWVGCVNHNRHESIGQTEPRGIPPGRRRRRAEIAALEARVAAKLATDPVHLYPPRALAVPRRTALTARARNGGVAGPVSRRLTLAIGLAIAGLPKGHALPAAGDDDWLQRGRREGREAKTEAGASEQD